MTARLAVGKRWRGDTFCSTRYTADMRLKACVITLTALAGTIAATASAQLGGFPLQLPENDFVWVWGRAQRGENGRRGIDDINIVASDGGFRCQFTAKMGIGSGMSPSEIRNLEEQLRSSLFFIQDTTYTMNVYDDYRRVDWAVLDCRKPEVNETEAELAEREAKARERAERRRERRRSREDE